MKNSKCKICQKSLSFLRICRKCSTSKLQRKYNLPYFILNTNLHKRFWDKVIKKKNGCWEWPKQLCNKKGYGCFSISYLSYRAHHIAWMIDNRQIIPNGKIICHKCDNPSCVSPEHLFLGINQDNVNDQVNKKRHVFGERNAGHKLTEEQVLQIRDLYKTMKYSMYRLAKMFGVTRPQIGHIINRIHWKHI